MKWENIRKIYSETIFSSWSVHGGKIMLGKDPFKMQDHFLIFEKFINMVS
jgi:hypothetical protein